MTNRKGSALLIVIMAFAFLMILGTGVLAMSLTETRAVTYQEQNIKAEYSARSGAEAMASYIIANPDEAQAIIDDTAIQAATSTLNGKTVEVVVTGDPAAPVITSKAFADGREMARVRLAMKGEPYDLLQFSVFSHLTPEMGKGHNGNVGTNSNEIDVHNNSSFWVNGNLSIVGNQTDLNNLDVKAGYEGQVRPNVNPIPEIDETLFNATLPSQDAHHVTGSTPEYFKASTLNDGFTASGGGTVHILVDWLGGNFDATVLNNTRVVVYCNASSISFNGNPNIPFVIYAPNATVSIAGGGNGSSNGGQIICKEYNGPPSNAFDFNAIDISLIDLGVTDLTLDYSRETYGQ